MNSQNAKPAVGSKSWAVVNSHPNQEQIAMEHLARQNFDVYCPQLLKRRVHARRADMVRRPLFPGYLFVGLDPERERWRPILSTIGVRSLVHFGGRPGLLSNDFVHSLRLREKDGLIEEPKPAYQIGQRVRFSGGPFDGVAATILSLGEKERLVVLMNLLQRQAAVKVAAHQVTPA